MFAPVIENHFFMTINRPRVTSRVDDISVADPQLCQFCIFMVFLTRTFSISLCFLSFSFDLIRVIKICDSSVQIISRFLYVFFYGLAK